MPGSPAVADDFGAVIFGIFERSDRCGVIVGELGDQQQFTRRSSTDDAVSVGDRSDKACRRGTMRRFIAVVGDVFVFIVGIVPGCDVAGKVFMGDFEVVVDDCHGNTLPECIFPCVEDVNVGVRVDTARTGKVVWCICQIPLVREKRFFVGVESV